MRDFSPARPNRAYPRAYGGTSHAVAASVAKVGLSPRVRGNRLWL